LCLELGLEVKDLHTNVTSTEVDCLFCWGVVVCSHVGDWTVVLDVVGNNGDPLKGEVKDVCRSKIRDRGQMLARPG